MSIRFRLSELADSAGDRYGQLLDTLRGMQMRLLEIHGARHSFVAALGEEAYAIARSYLENESAHISQAIEEIASDARTDAGQQLQYREALEETEALSELLSETERYLYNVIAIQIERDIATLREQGRQTLTQIRHSASLQNQSFRSALIQHRISNARETEFFFYARNAAKWPSRRYIRTSWRHTLLSVYNETIIALLVEHGETAARIDHPDASYHAQGRVISLIDGAALPTYLEVRNELFHPNSDAILRRSD